MQEEEGMESCMVWLGIADGMKAEVFTCAAAEAWLISSTPKLALHACMLFTCMSCYSSTHIQSCVYVPETGFIYASCAYGLVVLHICMSLGLECWAVLL